MKDFTLPKQGDKMYVGSSFYVYRGSEDFAGGIATVDRIILSDHLPEDHCNFIMVAFKERPGYQYNYRLLLDEQDKLKERFGDQVAHPDPDDRPEFNDDEEGWS